MNTLSSIIKGHAIRIGGHFVNHSKNIGSHIQKHHRKYLFGAVGGAILFKAIALILAGVGINYSINNDTFADNESEYCYLTGQELTGGYETGCYLTGEYLTEGTMTGCYMEGQELTGGYLDESGNLVGQYLDGGYLTGCHMEGQELTGGHLEGCHMEGQELTGGYMTCESKSGSVTSGNNSTDNQNLENNSNNDLENTTNTCSYSGFSLVSILSGAIIGGDIPLNREYCAENNANIEVQLLDHNHQRVNIAIVPGNESGSKFNSKLLATGYNLSGVNYGMYHIIAQNNSGSNYYVFTGSYTGNYTDYYTGYKLRFIQNSNILYTTDYTFTIDNKSPIISLISFNVTPTYTGKAYLNSVSEIIIQSNEVLSGVSFMVNNYAGGITVTQSGNTYKIYQTLSSNNNSGSISYTLQYYDLASNAGAYSNTSSIIFIPNSFKNSTGTNNTGTLATTNTGTQTGNSIGSTLMDEISKFNTCKKGVAYKELKLNIHGYTYVLQMPEFQKSYVKKLINAFTLVILSDIEKNKSLTQTNLESITSKFNNFLTVLKLVRDDDNKCKQGLSNYHITEFKKMLIDYNLYSD